MGLRQLSLQKDYRSGQDRIIDDFFRVCLRYSKSYWRAVGYFSSTALESFGTPLAEFIKNDGHIRLVTSVELSQADLEAIENGIPRKVVCTERLQQIIDTDFADGVGDGTVRLARLLELGRLEIQIAVPKNGTGIYHEKIGLFLDEEDFVAFTGSSNESRNALENNRECVDVYTSWESEERATRKLVHFRELWSHQDVGVEVFSFPQALRKKLLRICDRNGRAGTFGGTSGVANKWRHQEKALQLFVASERGVLNMATGTGKTRIALNILRTLFEQDEIDTVIVCAYGNDLLDQWRKEILSIRKLVPNTLRVLRHYREHREIQNFTVDPIDAILLVSHEPVAHVLRRLTGQQGNRTLLIYDEVHALGSPENRRRLRGLSEKIRFRLGLSATPERMYDKEGNDFIANHVGPVLMTFDLDRAIKRGILAPFDYHPLSFELTSSDRERITAIHARRKALEAEGTPMSEIDLWIQLARVHKTSKAKLPVFAEFIEQHKQLLERCIIFVETMEYGKAVLEIVHEHRPDFHTYFSGEDSKTLEKFASGDLECLITCHRLSEGIDIKSLNTVILFASDKARLETIQRIGRCLRVDPNNPQKVASIVDFVRTGSAGSAPNTDEQRREWLEALARVRSTS